MQIFGFKFAFIVLKNLNLSSKKFLVKFTHFFLKNNFPTFYLSNLICFENVVILKPQFLGKLQKESS